MITSRSIGAVLPYRNSVERGISTIMFYYKNIVNPTQSFLAHWVWQTDYPSLEYGKGYSVDI